MFHADLSSAGRVEALRRFETSANVVMLATEAAERTDIGGIQQVVLQHVTGPVEKLLQMLGRCNRPSRTPVQGAQSFGIFTVMMRREDVQSYIFNLTRQSGSNGQPKIDGLKEIGKVLMESNHCIMLGLHQLETGRLDTKTCNLRPGYAPCPACARLLVQLVSCDPMTVGAELIFAALTDLARVFDIRFLAGWLTGSADQTIKRKVGELGSEQSKSYKSGSDVHTRADFEKLANELIFTGYIAWTKIGDLSFLQATDHFCKWYNTVPRGPILLSQQNARSFHSLIRPTRVLRRLEGSHHAELEWKKLDQNENVVLTKSAFATAVDVLGVSRVPRNQIGDESPLWNAKPTIMLVEEQWLLLPNQCVLTLFQSTYKIDNDSTTLRSLSAGVQTEMKEKLTSVGRIAEFLGLAKWDMKVAKCTGAMQCGEKNGDGSLCGQFRSRLSKQHCLNREHTTDFVSVKCGARIVVMHSDGRFIVVPMDRCSAHPDLPVTKVPDRVRLELRNLVQLGNATPDRLLVDDLNNGQPLLLCQICPALNYPTVVSNILKKAVPADKSMAAAVAATRIFEQEKDFPFLRSVCLHSNPEEPQVVVMFHSHQLVQLRRNPCIAADSTFSVFQNLTGKGHSKWVLYNMAILLYGKVVTVAEICVNGNTKEHYRLIFDCLLHDFDEADSEQAKLLQNEMNINNAGDVIAEAAAAEMDDRRVGKPDRGSQMSTADLLVSMIFDFERQEATAWLEALVNRYGKNEGQIRFENSLKLCTVHWLRICHRRGKRFGSMKLFLAIARAIMTATSASEARVGLLLLKKTGHLSVQSLREAGLSEPTIKEFVDQPTQETHLEVSWEKNADWVDNLCSVENQFILDALAMAHGRRSSSNDTNAAEASHLKKDIRKFKAMPANSNGKSPVNVLTALIEDKFKKFQQFKLEENGAVITGRNISGDAHRKNQAQQRKDQVLMEVAAEASSKKSKTNPVLKCVCKGECSTRCSCYKLDQACSLKCKCKCEKETKVRDPKLTKADAQIFFDERKAAIAGVASESPLQPEAQDQQQQQQLPQLPPPLPVSLLCTECDFMKLCASCATAAERDEEALQVAEEQHAAKERAVAEKKKEDERAKEEEQKQLRKRALDDEESLLSLCAKCSLETEELTVACAVNSGSKKKTCDRVFHLACANPLPTERQKHAVDDFQCAGCRDNLGDRKKRTN